MPNKVELEWNGEIIKQHVTVPDLDISPKTLLDSLERAANQVNNMTQQLAKLEGSKKQMMNEIDAAQLYLKERQGFEAKCIEIQLAHLKKYIAIISADCKDRAVVDTDKTVALDPSAYTPDQKKNMYYVMYQRFLATHEKIAKKISANIIKEHLYNKPIFDNPF